MELILIVQATRDRQPVFRQHVDRGLAFPFVDGGDFLAESRGQALAERGRIAHAICLGGN